MSAEPVDEAWEHLKPYGYAPGHYMNKCHRCGQVVTGVDKRAIACRPCAEERHSDRATLDAAVAAAVAQERERCARLCEDWATVRNPEHGGLALLNVAAAIRNLTPEGE